MEKVVIVAKLKLPHFEVTFNAMFAKILRHRQFQRTEMYIASKYQFLSSKRTMILIVGVGHFVVR